MKSEVENFYAWMQSINNAFLSDNEQMTNAFRIVALQDENDRLKKKLKRVREMINEMEVEYNNVNPEDDGE